MTQKQAKSNTIYQETESSGTEEVRDDSKRSTGS